MTSLNKHDQFPIAFWIFNDFTILHYLVQDDSSWKECDANWDAYEEQAG